VATQLNASATYNGATVPGAFTYTPVGGTVLAAGPQKLSASFTPTDTADYNAPPATSNSLTVNQAGTTTSLIASATSLIPGQSLTLIAVVKSSTTGTPTGSVGFYDGTSLLGTAALNGDTASFPTSALASGITHTLSATYTGDSNFLTSTSASSVSIPVAALDFSLNLSGIQTQTVIPGNAASFAFQVTPTYGSYPAQVTFGVAGLPPGATAVFSPASIPANGGAQTITLTIQTPSPTAQNRTLFPRGAASITLCFLLFPLFGHRRTRRGMLLVFVAALTLAGAASLSGCGAGNGFNAQPPTNYTLIVTATSAQAQHTANVVLNAQ
jgi:large repetitive protein